MTTNKRMRGKKLAMALGCSGAASSAKAMAEADRVIKRVLIFIIKPLLNVDEYYGLKFRKMVGALQRQVFPEAHFQFGPAADYHFVEKVRKAVLDTDHGFPAQVRHLGGVPNQ